MQITLKDILKQQKIIPHDIELYKEAITHPTFVNENKGAKHYQRLEFLGDAILDAYVSINIFQRFRDFDEGQMSMMRSNAVNAEKLAEFAEEINLDKIIRFGNSANNLKDNVKIKSDVFEAFIAAIYLDQGRDVLVRFMKQNTFKFIKETNGEIKKNPKTELQEFLQSESRDSIKYDVKKTEKGFVAKVSQSGNTFGTGQGQTKKQAEVAAAEDALRKVGK